MTRLAALFASLLFLALGACIATGTVPCEAPKTACSDRACANLDTDPLHCGDCSRACATGEACVQGSCACAPGTSLCGGACVDLDSDSAHCGTCDKACSLTELCQDRDCVSACGAGRTACGGGCIDTSTDRAHCGRCDHPCAQGQSCVAGGCTSTIFATCFNTGELVALDDALTPAASTVVVGEQPQSIAMGVGTLVVGEAQGRLLAHFDPKVAPPRKETWGDEVGHVLNQVVVRGGKASVVSSGDNNVQVIDLTRPAPAGIDASRTIDQIPTRPPSTGSELNTNPVFEAIVGERLYVTLLGTCDDAGDAAGNRLLEIDFSGAQGAVTRELVFAAADYANDRDVPNSPRPAGIAALGTRLLVAIGNLAPGCWGTAGPGYLAVVDVAEPTLSAANLELPAECRNPGFVVATGTRIYVSCLGSYGSGSAVEESLVVLDANTLELVRTTVLPRCAPGEVGDGPTACRTAVPGRMSLRKDRLLIADANAGRLFATDLDGALVPGLELGVPLCAPRCDETGHNCYQFTSDVFGIP